MGEEDLTGGEEGGTGGEVGGEEVMVGFDTDGALIQMGLGVLWDLGGVDEEGDDLVSGFRSVSGGDVEVSEEDGIVGDIGATEVEGPGDLIEGGED